MLRRRLIGTGRRGREVRSRIVAVVGPGDFRAQAERVFANLGVALASVGASFGDLLKTTTYVTDVKHVALLRDIRTRHLDSARPPANTLLVVAGLARPELMLKGTGPRAFCSR